MAKLDNPDIDSIVADFSQLRLLESKQVVQFRKQGPPSKKQKAARKWYDQSLKSLKKEIHQLNSHLSQLIHTQK